MKLSTWASKNLSYLEKLTGKDLESAKSDAKFYDDQYGPDEPGGGSVEDFKWYAGYLPFSILGNRRTWASWMRNELSDPDGERIWGWLLDQRRDEEDPIIVVEGTDGEAYIWDGHHRTGAAAIADRKDVYAIVGMRIPQTAWNSSRSASKRAPEKRNRSNAMRKRRNIKETYDVVPDETVWAILKAVARGSEEIAKDIEDFEDVEVTVNDGRTGALMPGGWGAVWLVKLDGLEVVDLLSHAERDDKAYEALKKGIRMTPGIAVVELFSVGGTEWSSPRITVHPADISPKMLPSELAIDLTFPEAVALMVADSIVPAYDVQYKHWTWDMKFAGQKHSQAIFEKAYEGLMDRSLVKWYGQTTTKGKNLARKLRGGRIQGSVVDLMEMYKIETKKGTR